MFGTLAVPVLSPLLLHVDVAGGGVVGGGLQNRPVASEVHQTWRREGDEETEEGYVAKFKHTDRNVIPTFIDQLILKVMSHTKLA